MTLKRIRKFLVASGGKGGLGNLSLKSSLIVHQKKRRMEKIEEFWIWLQLK